MTSYRDRKAQELQGTLERRQFATPMELRDNGDAFQLSGYASTFEPYKVGDFRETIAPGAFKRTLGEDPDVVLLVNHGKGAGGMPLARTKSGTLTLTEDHTGLRVEASLDPDDPDVRALAPKMRRGDLDSMSFAFRATAQTWNENRTERLIRGVSLHQGDVSVVTMPANPSTNVLLRSRTDGAASIDITTRAAQELDLLGVRGSFPHKPAPDSRTQRQIADLDALRRR
jgi:HK97 family phage prohead protease